jgi:hypothetical protein
LEGGSRALSSRNGSGPEAAVKARIFELERIIGKQTVRIEILKKFLSKAGGCLSGRWLKDSGYSVTVICTALG